MNTNPRNGYTRKRNFNVETFMTDFTIPKFHLCYGEKEKSTVGTTKVFTEFNKTESVCVFHSEISFYYKAHGENPIGILLVHMNDICVEFLKGFLLLEHNNQ